MRLLLGWAPRIDLAFIFFALAILLQGLCFLALRMRSQRSKDDAGRKE